MTDGSHRKTAILVGVLFLTSTATFAIGDSLLTSYFSGKNLVMFTLTLGVLLQVYTGLAVAGIGVAMLPLLKPHNAPLAHAYLGLRLLECLAIIAIGATILTTLQPFQHHHLIIYLFNAVGGIIFSYLLYTSRLIPQPLALLGIVGYAVLLLGIPIAFFGLVSLDAGLGLGFLVPGGLFELILPLWLFVRGFQVPTTRHA